MYKLYIHIIHIPNGAILSINKIHWTIDNQHAIYDSFSGQYNYNSEKVITKYRKHNCPCYFLI